MAHKNKKSLQLQSVCLCCVVTLKRSLCPVIVVECETIFTGLYLTVGQGVDPPQEVVDPPP